MNSSLQKLRNNIISARAFRVLGPRTYADYVGRFLLLIPEIRRVGDLRPLDQAMGTVVGEFNYRGAIVKVDCEFCDDMSRENSYTFGAIRELLIRDCYFKYHSDDIYRSAKNVVDLGANRGVFSALMTPTAKFVLSVEALGNYTPLIRRNMELNGFTNYAIEIGTVGLGGSLSADEEHSFSFSDLLDRHGLSQIDFIKMDIEGSEFSLFGKPEWLEITRSLSMEVHRKYGDPQILTKTLKRLGFRYVLADQNLQPVFDPSQADFLYASRNN